MSDVSSAVLFVMALVFIWKGCELRVTIDGTQHTLSVDLGEEKHDED